MEFGWSVEYVMQMPARRFFAVKKAMHQLDLERRVNNYLELCDIHFIPNARAEYTEELKNYYRSRIYPDFASRINNPRYFDVTKDDEAKKVTNILDATFAQQARLMGLRTK